MIKTQVTWNRPLPNAEKDLAEAKLQTMLQQEKTDGVEIVIDDTPGGRIVERHWYTKEYADEWLSFIRTLDPATAIIVDE
jgi:hypothetical protein